jgi:hypothetical protein
VDAGVAARELGDQPAPAGGERLHARVGGLDARGPQLLGLRDQRRSLGLGPADRVVAELFAPSLELLELRGRVVLLVHRHPFDRFEEQLRGGAVGAVFAVRPVRAVERGEQAG